MKKKSSSAASTITSNNNTNLPLLIHENHEIYNTNNGARQRQKCIPCSAVVFLLFMALGITFLLLVDPMDYHSSSNNSLLLSSSSSSFNNNNNNNNNNNHSSKNSVPYRMKDYTKNGSNSNKQQQQSKWRNYWFGGKIENEESTATSTSTNNVGKIKFDRHHDNNTKNQQQTGLAKIQEAIDNIDRIFMNNRPVVPVHDTAERGEESGTKEKKKRKKKKTTGNQQGREDELAFGDDEDSVDSALADSDNYITGGGGGGGGYDDNNSIIAIGGEDVPLVLDAEDDDALAANADALDAYARTLPASDALECRASVVAFVINATDVKDECDGLRKAFDKACSVQAQNQQQPPPLPPQESHQQQYTVRQRRILNQGMTMRRVLSERGRPHTSKLIPEVFHGFVQQWMVRHRVDGKAARRLSNPSLHRVEVVEFSNGENETNAYRSGVERRGLEGEEEQGRGLDEGLDDESSLVQQQVKKQDQTAVAPPIISLNIPTENEHLSEQMLNDALLLQDTESLQAGAAAVAATPPSNAVDSPTNQLLSPPLSSKSAVSGDFAASSSNNVTVDTQVAVQDVAESAEAIRTAVEGVKKSMMNDPKSVEARTCCASILSVFHEHCDPTTKGVEDYSDQRLLVVVFVITVCGIIKSMIRHLNIRWLPEAGGCILVGVFGYLILQHMPHVRFAFDGDMFLRIMVPPIVFEAAVKINKQSFRRHVIPITIFAIVGTLASTAFTALILHKGSSMFGSYVPTIPPRESLIFGALISSIDPIAVLSVLSNMGMTDTDTIYVLIFGESLLNDGVAIVLFQTLVHFLDESLVIDSDVVLDASIHFVVVALGSISVGVASGVCATLYFSLMHGCQTPMVEVIMFCCWSFIPYYICDMVEWSGIVAIVANGFVMDLFVIGQTHVKQQQQLAAAESSTVDSEIDFLVNGTSGTVSNNTNGTPSRRYKQQQCRSAFTYEGHLSQTADTHVHFVIEIFATLMETAIFAYLGLFLFSSRYHWNGYLTVLSIFATVMGRVFMIPILSYVANLLNRMRISRQRQRYPTGSLSNINDEVHIDRRMQLVLVFAGLRGAMSFALVEHIPMFDTTTGQGSRLKPELKAMTSASVIFTLFVLGGATSYLMERLGYSLNTQQGQQNSVEIVSLLHNNHEKRTPTAAERKSNGMFSQANDNGLRNNGQVRQRGSR